MITILALGGGLALLLIVIGIIVSITSERSLVEERLGQYLEEQTVEQTISPDSTPLTDWLNVQVKSSQWGESISKNLAQADVKLKPAEYVALMVIAAISLGAISWLLGGKSIVSGLIGMIIGVFLPRFYVGKQKTNRLHKFNEQLPDMLNLMVNGLRAGYSTMQAMEAISKEMPDPISSEFRRVVQEMQLGIPMEDALSNLFRRINSDDLDLILTAINVQREVGGNLAEILDTISYTIRERVRIKGEIRVLVSQVMYSGKFLSLLPVILALLLWFLNRDYLMTLFQPENRICGFIVIGVAAILITSGYLAMNKIADIEV
ncbi:MAG: type II secretion system F family protein [Anaerolineales bacterium]|nr:type II secretion system F family protein [Anaerolineales bacterium]